ncbi:MAG: hypothetical protein ACRCT7_02300, partial [Shewanella sp.]
KGESLLCLSLLSAYRAGFTRAVLVIRPEIEAAVAQMLSSLPAEFETVFVYQSLDDLPVATSIDGRTKPWGTAQALYAARHAVTGPMAVITADDYYGQAGFDEMARALSQGGDSWNMISYQLGNTLSEHGGVNRGICQVEHGLLKQVQEWIQIQTSDAGLVGQYQGRTQALLADTPVSMTFWGFTPSIFNALTLALSEFISQAHLSLTAECYLPDVVQSAIDNGQALHVWPTTDRWLGVTYPQDAQRVKMSLLEYWGD